MLRKFRVSNFKSFEKDFELDLTQVNGYEFNKESIKNGVVNNAIIYGKNGEGKSNLAFAIFDIILQLMDNGISWDHYENYLNANSQDEIASFYFEFLFNSKIVVYEYKKKDYKSISFESFRVDGKEFILLDRRKSNQALILLKGAETLKNNIENDQMSVLKYIRNNSELEKDDINNVFFSLFEFVQNMIFFRSLLDASYIGVERNKRPILEEIVLKDNVNHFERFLNQAGIECKLEVIFDEFGRKSIAFKINGKILSFWEIASTGTKALSLFYFWYQELLDKSKVSFLFIDEFDAFYHHALSVLIVEKLKETGVQFMLTTHNTSVMSNDLLRPDCYFVMTKNSIQPLSKITERELREAHNLEKMYKAGTFYV